MDLRAILEKHRVIVLVLVVVALGFVSYRAATGRRYGHRLENQRFFYDLTTGDLAMHDARDLSPVRLKSGHEGVLAHVFSCTSCEDRGSYRVAYVEKYPEDARAKVLASRQATSPDPSAAVAAENLRLVAKPGQPLEWTPITSAQAARIMDVASNCPDGRAQLCLPR